MALLALDLNDAGITALDEDGIVYREPGFALVEENGLTTGIEAYANARIQPRRIHAHYWSSLTTEPLPDERFRHLSAADLVSRQVEQLWNAARGRGDRVAVAVPHYMQAANLSLFLGICDDLGIPVIALADAAVAATRRQYLNATPIHVDVSLHATLMTRIGQDGEARVEKSEVVEGSGLSALHDTWIRTLAEAFVQQSRFDPLHTAETEQLLLDRLPGWLATASGGEPVSASVEYRGIEHTAEIEALTLVSAAAPSYHRVLSQLRTLVRADETPAIQLTDRAASLPGLADMLKARVGGEVFVLESGAAQMSTGAAVCEIAALVFGQDRLGLRRVESFGVREGLRIVRHLYLPGSLSGRAPSDARAVRQHRLRDQRGAAEPGFAGVARRAQHRSRGIDARRFPQALFARRRERAVRHTRLQPLRHVPERPSAPPYCRPATWSASGRPDSNSG